MKKKYVIPILGFLIISLLACIEKPEEDTTESTENNKASFINNPSKFFYLSKLGKSQQPDGSYVCWAACLANIHNGFYPKKNLTYCKILDENGLACSKSRASGTTIKSGFNFVKPIKEIIKKAKTINIEFSKSKKNIFSNYDSVVKFLNTQKIPIIIQKVHPKQTHILYVAGYGTRKGCNYYYEFDPENGEENYIRADLFVKDTANILGVWYPRATQDLGNLSIIEDTDSKIFHKTEAYIREFYKNNPNCRKDSSLALNNVDVFTRTTNIDLEDLKKKDFLKRNKKKLLSKSCSGDISFKSANPENIEYKLNALCSDTNLEIFLPRHSSFNTQDGKLELDIEFDSARKAFYSLKLDGEISQDKTPFDEGKLRSQLKNYNQVEKL